MIFLNNALSPLGPIIDYQKLIDSNKCCTDGRAGLQAKKKEEDNAMNMNALGLFNGIFGRIAPGMCRITMNGKIAVKTSNGYKSYNVETGRLTNCSNFVFDIGEEAFFVVPTNRATRGDILLIGGKPHCVLKADKNNIKAFCYEDSSIHDIVTEHHVFLGKNFLYGKIVSIFGDIYGGTGTKKMMKFMMLNQLMNGSGNNSNNGMAGMLPMLMLMGNGGDVLGGILDFDLDDEAEEVEEPEESEEKGE